MSRGFTLIELALVVALLSILSAGALVVVERTVDSRSVEDVIESLKHRDFLARATAAREGRPQELVFDLEEGSITQRRPGSSAPLDRYLLPRGVRLKGLRVNRGGGATLRSGETVVFISKEGHSQSYAVEVEAKDGTERTVLVSGLSGQALEVTPRAVEKVFQALKRSHAP